MSKQASQRWTSRSLDYICRAAPKSRSKATIRVMNDKTQSEHNRSALGGIATEALPSRAGCAPRSASRALTRNHMPQIAAMDVALDDCIE
jgi:hypothetical protein